MAKDTRERMVAAAVVALQQRGLEGMSFTDVLARSGAARGAIYHHFPGGKGQLAAEAAAQHGRDVLAHMAELSGSTPRAVAEAFVDFARPVVEASTRGSGCAIAAVTLSADGSGHELCRVAATAFASWSGRLAEALAESGLSHEDAEDKAALLISLLEGAQVLSRAAGGTAPFDRAVRAALPLFDAKV
ncbi:TetR/AcrR family transcriptional regulator [Streptomyces sp. NBC_01351]|uniref:TetR/AcrR family transcriptional regulator n=1 Tax=Streptomyces sp. NBC_01351 TaxID=2903833 RepID=UPI002E330D91|nr:TetR/AcrR family transcriptional regulator [Streptomyces sp. NBC_01351]